jgi:hypothetical protein
MTWAKIGEHWQNSVCKTRQNNHTVSKVPCLIPVFNLVVLIVDNLELQRLAI